MFNWKSSLYPFDERRSIIVPGNAQQTILFSVQQFLQVAQDSIADHGFFAVALSGGSTPNAIFKELSQPSYANRIDWKKVFCFWSDERSVPPDHPESNFHMAMQAGLALLPIPQHQIFRMQAETNIEENAKKYEELFFRLVPSKKFDLLMLGVGEDGHTASLFPHTQALHSKDQFIVANEVPQKNTWRMSVSYACIEATRLVCLYAIGKSKADIVAQVLLGPYKPELFPAQKVGLASNKAVWILDQEAASKLQLKVGTDVSFRH